MKLKDSNYGFEGELPDQATQFSIKTSAKMFDILSSGIYKDKIAAVIRELSCNAYDAHVAAGKKNKPFTVVLPNQLSPIFAVEDEGTGIDPSKIAQIYWTYGESSKTNTNTQIGALGLGSKSPFAYTKSSFIVRNRYNGREYNYLCFINKNGVPAGSLMSDEPTAEAPGVRVELAVMANDITAFRERAVRFFRFWKQQPNITGQKVTIEMPKVISAGNGWQLYARDFNNTINRAYAVMGGVPYPIDPNAIPNVTEIERFLLNSSIVIDFTMGELNFSASREELSYDEFTVKSLRARINEICADLRKELYAQVVAKHQTHYDFVSTFSDNIEKIANSLAQGPRDVVDLIFKKNMGVPRSVDEVIEFRGVKYKVYQLLNRQNEVSFQTTKPMTVGLWRARWRHTTSSMSKHSLTRVEYLYDQTKSKPAYKVEREWRFPDEKNKYLTADGFVTKYTISIASTKAGKTIVINDCGTVGQARFCALAKADVAYKEAACAEGLKPATVKEDLLKIFPWMDDYTFVLLSTLPDHRTVIEREKNPRGDKKVYTVGYVKLKGQFTKNQLNNLIATLGISTGTNDVVDSVKLERSLPRFTKMTLGELKIGTHFFVYRTPNLKLCSSDPYGATQHSSVISNDDVCTYMMGLKLLPLELTVLALNGGQVNELQRKGVKLKLFDEYVEEQVKAFRKETIECWHKISKTYTPIPELQTINDFLPTTDNITSTKLWKAHEMSVDSFKIQGVDGVTMIYRLKIFSALNEIQRILTLGKSDFKNYPMLKYITEYLNNHAGIRKPSQEAAIAARDYIKQMEK